MSPFKPSAVQPDYSSLFISLANSHLQTKDNALYQTIFLLIQQITKAREILVNNIEDLDENISALIASSFLTENNETVFLPNSRQLLAGTNVTFDDTVVGERTINVTSSIDHVVLSDGGLPIPLPIDDGFGNFIYLQYTP